MKALLRSEVHASTLRTAALAATAGAAGLCLILSGCARFTSTVTERLGPDGRTIERITVVKAGTFFDSKSDLAKLSSGQTDKSQKVSIGSINQESSATNVVNLVESVISAAVRAAVKP